MPSNAEVVGSFSTSISLRSTEEPAPCPAAIRTLSAAVEFMLPIDRTRSINRAGFIVRTLQLFALLLCLSPRGLFAQTLPL